MDIVLEQEAPVLHETQADFEKIKANYATDGNVINYVAGLLEARYKGQEKEYTRELTNNVLTAIIEHPIGESIGKFEYSNEWTIDEQGNLRLRGHSEWLDDIYKRGWQDKTEQIPHFEKIRNWYDSQILELLTDIRKEGIIDEAVVKFSPTPPGWDFDPIIQSRGYKGLDQICIFTQKGNQEHIEVLWFPQTTSIEYQNLLHELFLADPEHESIQRIQHLCVMNEARIDEEMLSRFSNFSKAQVQVVREFASQRQNTFVQNQELIQDYIKNHIFPFVINQIVTEISHAAIKLSQESLSMADLEIIHNAMSNLQIQLRAYIAEVSGIDTFDNKFKNFMKMNNIKHGDIASGKYSTREIAQKSGYKMSGCGIGNKPKKMSKEELRIKNPEKFAELYIYRCPRCGHVHDIDVPNQKLVHACVQCGMNADC